MVRSKTRFHRSWEAQGFLLEGGRWTSTLRLGHLNKTPGCARLNLCDPSDTLDAAAGVICMARKPAITSCFLLITAVVTISFIAPTGSSQGRKTPTANPDTAQSVHANVDKLFAQW